MNYIEIIRNGVTCIVFGAFLFSGSVFSEIPYRYFAKPFRDSIQQIPGRFFVWRYDEATIRGISWQTPRKKAMTGDYYQYDGRKTASVEDFIITRILNPAWDVYGTSTYANPANPGDTVVKPLADTTLIYNDMKAVKDGIYRLHRTRRMV